jgi:lysophospholipase L1-like esterase
MRLFALGIVVYWVLLGVFTSVDAQDKSPGATITAKYEYEVKPDDEAFTKFNPAKALAVGPMLLREGDRLAIVGDSITEQKMYSRIIENYLTVCVPELKITVRQYGWSGEKTDGFLNRMDRDCLTFKPTIATLCYGMNDARYRPFDVTNGQWYRDHYTAIVRRFKESGTRVVLGSPGCSGKIASWVKSRSGTLEEHNLNLCALRDIAMGVAQSEQVAFADIFWPMYQQQILAPKRFHKSAEDYAVAGKDGIHPGWAGQVMMAYAFLTAMGLDGDLGTINVNMADGKATATGRHTVDSFVNGSISLTSHQYPYCAQGEVDLDDSIRSGMTLVPFGNKLNRFILKASGVPSNGIKVTWGEESQSFTAAEAATGINLADKFVKNPFSAAFARVDAAVLTKQTYETKQVKQIFHGERGKQDFAKAVAETEAERQPLVEAIASSFVPVQHVITIE